MVNGEVRVTNGECKVQSVRLSAQVYLSPLTSRLSPLILLSPKLIGVGFCAPHLFALGIEAAIPGVHVVGVSSM